MALTALPWSFTGINSENLYSSPGNAEWARDFAVLQGRKPQEYRVYFKMF